MRDRTFITQLILLIIILIVGLPVIAGLSMIMLMGLVFLFLILVIAIAVTSAPIIAGFEPSIAVLIQGIPQNTIFLFGISIVCFGLVLFTLYIFVVKQVFRFLIGMLRRMVEGGHRHG